MFLLILDSISGTAIDDVCIGAVLDGLRHNTALTSLE
jgi:hypothetical protein